MLWRPSCFGVRREHSLTCGRLVVGRISVRSHVAPIHDRWMHCSLFANTSHASVRTTGNRTRDERYFDRIRPPVTLNDYETRALRLCTLHDFPEIDYPSFRSGEFRSRSLHHRWIVYDAELITNIATRISYRCEKISFFLSRKEPRRTCQLQTTSTGGAFKSRAIDREYFLIPDLMSGDDVET